MAFRSNGPIVLALPPFRGTTRRILLIALGSFFLFAVVGLAARGVAEMLASLVRLRPVDALHGLVWEFVTYPFLDSGLLGTAFAMLSVWFFGASLEDERGARWLGEYFLATTIGGGLLASLLALAAGERVPGLSAGAATAGLWPFVLALVLAFARFHAEQTLRFNFIFQLKAKYLAAIYVLFYLASALVGGDRFGALVALSNALAGYAYLRFAPARRTRGPGAALSEWWFGLRNDYDRAKRRRAAKKFTVYMKKQGKEVSLDAEGRYIDPNGTPRDLNDRNWMN